MLRNKYCRVCSLLSTFGISMASFVTFADTNIFTALDDPSSSKKNFDGNVQASYHAQGGNILNFNLTASTNMTWFQQGSAYSIWGGATNNSFNNQRSLEKYKIGARARYNLGMQGFLFAQGGWLSDRYNGYRFRDTLVTGYGLQVLTGPIYTLRIEAGPGVRHDEYQSRGSATKTLGYAAASYNYQLTDNTTFIQGLSVFSNDYITVNSETGLNVDINGHFALKFSYSVTWNENYPESIPKHIDTKTSVSLVYKIQ